MVNVLETVMPNIGRPPKIKRMDQLLMTLMYSREYRAQFHIAQVYGVSEATVSQIIRKVEDALIKSGQFRLPGKKSLQLHSVMAEFMIFACSKKTMLASLQASGV